MNWSKTAVVYKKELLDTFRDRRFLYSAILTPILIFPILLLGFGSLAFMMGQRTAKQDQKVMILGAEHAPELTKRIEKTRLELRNFGDSVARVELVPLSSDYVKLINEKKLQATVEIPAQFEEILRTSPDRKQVVKIYHYQDELRSSVAVRVVRKAIDDYAKEVAGGRLGARGLSIELLTPFEFERSNVASAEKVSGNILGLMLPYMIILLCLTGAMYPAMDTTAGEKERGTMETILASPAGRMDIVAGKFLMVLTVAMITTFLTIASMAVTVLLGSQFLQRISTRLVLTVSGKAIATVILIVLPLAVFFSAALLAISVFARNYKEAQSYIGPLMFLVIIPAMASFLPGVELNPKMALIPILNVSLLAKEIFAGNFPTTMVALIFGSTTVYAALAIYLAVRQFQKEEVLFRT